MQFYFQALPGDTLTYTVTLDSIRDGRRLCPCHEPPKRSTSKRRPNSFSCASAIHARAGRALPPRELAELMCALGAFAVGRAADGGPSSDACYLEKLRRVPMTRLVPAKTLLSELDRPGRSRLVVYLVGPPPPIRRYSTSIGPCCRREEIERQPAIHPRRRPDGSFS